MDLCAYDAVFPEVGVDDYRVLVIGEGQALPPERYVMQEFYCADTDCDCRRVTVRLIPESNPEFAAAFISYGWETPSFYRKWSKGPGDDWREMCGASLAELSEQGPDAPELLRFFEHLVSRDPALTAHFRRQYRKVKERVKSSEFKAPKPPAGLNAPE